MSRNTSTTREKIWAWQARNAPYMFVAPFVILFCCFMVYPMISSLILSFYQTSGSLKNMEFAGAKNYSYVLTTKVFLGAVLNSLLYTAAFLIFQLPAALMLAIALNSERVRGRNVFRFAFFAPHLVGQVFVAVIFGLMLNNNGPVNKLIRYIVPNIELNWMSNAYLARPAVVLASMWLSVGFGMIYFLASLQSVDKELYEAADVDGAGAWSKFRHITLPGIKPVLIFMILTGTIGGLQLFELPYVLFQGAGPGGAGVTIVAYLFKWVEAGELGTAAAIGWLLAAVIITISLIQIKLTKSTNPKINSNQE